MNITHTTRGFALVEFLDNYGVKCSLQESSIATDDCIWFGADKIGLKEFVAYRNPAWQDLPQFDENTPGHHYVANNRMHLTRQQVAGLLPFLQRFVETGSIDDTDLVETETTDGTCTT